MNPNATYTPVTGPTLIAYVPGKGNRPTDVRARTYTQFHADAKTEANRSAGQGHVRLRDSYRRRPSTLNVRQRWPADRRPHITGDPELDLNAQTWAAQMAHIPGLGRWAGKENTPAWRSHAWALRAALLRLYRGECVNNASLAALLDTIGQGIEETVYIMKSFITLPGATSVQAWENGDSDPDYRLPGPRSELVNANLPSASHNDEIIRGVAGKRLIASCVHIQSSRHWVAVVYDIHTQALMVFDAVPRGREGRLRSVALAWRQLLCNIGILDGFYAYCPALSEQPNNWSCGFMAAINIYHCVRAATGQRLSTHIRSFRYRMVSIDQQAEPPSAELYDQVELPIPVWKVGAQDTIEGFRRVEALLNAILCNEIGIESSEHLELIQMTGSALQNNHAGRQVRVPFFLRRPLPWEPYTLLMPEATDWKTVRYHVFGLAVQDNGNLTAPQDSAPAPLPRRTATSPPSRGQHPRYTIRCWNPRFLAFSESALAAAERGAFASDALSVASTESVMGDAAPSIVTVYELGDDKEHPIII